MPDRYWVGGTGTWNTTSTANWSTTSGGAAGASVPDAFDVVIFDGASGGGTVTLGETVSCFAFFGSNFTGTFAFSGNRLLVTGGNVGFAIFTENGTYSLSGEATVELTYSGSSGVRSISNSLPSEANAFSFVVTGGSDSVFMSTVAKNVDFTGFSGFSNLGSFVRTIYGSLTLSPTMIISGAGGNEITFAGTSGPYTLTTAGQTLPFHATFFGSGGTWRLADDFNMTGRNFRLGRGTFDANGKNVTLGTFGLFAGGKVLTLGSGTWTVTGASWNAETNKDSLTVSASTGTISMTSASAKTFAGGGFTWPTLNQGGAGILTVQQSNTFASIANTVSPATVRLTSGTTQTVTTLGLSGSAGNLVTLDASSAGSVATLTSTTASISVSYLSIKDNAATGGTDWYANNSTDAGNTSGWFFNPSTQTLNETTYALRSFTERRTF